jgi:hypothetical protein
MSTQNLIAAAHVIKRKELTFVVQFVEESSVLMQYVVYREDFLSIAEYCHVLVTMHWGLD